MSRYVKNILYIVYTRYGCFMLITLHPRPYNGMIKAESCTLIQMIIAKSCTLIQMIIAESCTLIQMIIAESCTLIQMKILTLKCHNVLTLLYHYSFL